MSALISQQQHTLAAPTEWVCGTTLRNHPALLRFLPAPPQSGRIIRLTQHLGTRQQTTFELAVTLASGRPGRFGRLPMSWTEIHGQPNQGLQGHVIGLGVIEHPGAAVVLAGLDNVILEAAYPGPAPFIPLRQDGRIASVPLMDGTAQPYLTAIHKSGVISQPATRRWLTVTKDVIFITADGKGRFVLQPRNTPGWHLTALSHPQASGKPTDHAIWSTSPENVPGQPLHTTPQAIANARPTNRHKLGLAQTRLMTLGSARKLDFAVVYNPFTHQPADAQPPTEPTEPPRHRLLDLLGDLWFFGGFWQVGCLAINGRHAYTHEFRQYLLKNPDLLRPA